MTTFKDKVIVITGGSSGIGKSIAKKFHSEGAKLAIISRSLQKLEMVQQEMGAWIFSGDVSKLADLNTFYKKVSETLGKIDVIVAAAGVNLGRRPVEYVTEDYFDSMLDINFKGAYFTVQCAIPYLNEENSSVILISSIAAKMGWAGFSVYAAAKAAVTALARNFSADLIHKNIRVNAVSPGFTDTGAFPPEFIETFRQKIPNKRFATPREIAELVAFLASPAASHIVGVDIPVDGGFSAITSD